MLDQESAASYHGYLLADMAVHQTTAWFLDAFGFIADNPEVGKILAEKYWSTGNSRSLEACVRDLTGNAPSPRALADSCNASPEEVWAAAEESIAAAFARQYPSGYPPSLDADIALVHGSETIADNSTSEARMCANFVAWVRTKYPRPA
jgi:hypothetical protein